MSEQDKQEVAQSAKEEQQDKKPLKGSAPKSTEQQAGMATDPKAMKDPGYVERIEEKTKKH